MANFENVTPGPKGVYNTGGEMVWIEGGASEDIEVTEGELASAKSTGHFVIDGEGERPSLATKAAEGSEAIEAARREVAEAAQAEIDRLTEKHDADLKEQITRAEDAESKLEALEGEKADLAKRVEELTAQLRDATGPDYVRDNLGEADIHKANKDVLLVIAAYEKADVADVDVATKADLVKAIEAKRKAGA